MRCTALLSHSHQLADVFMFPLEDATLCFFEDDVPLTTAVLVDSVERDGGSIDVTPDEHESNTNNDATTRKDDAISFSCKRYEIILSNKPNKLEEVQLKLNEECIHFLSRTIMASFSRQTSFSASSHQIPFQDVQQIYYGLSRILTGDAYSFSPSTRRYECPCNQDKCTIVNVINALGCELDWKEYNEIYESILLHKRKKYTKDNEKAQVRVCLAVDAESKPKITQAVSRTVSTTQFITNCTKSSMIVLLRSPQPLISINLCSKRDDCNSTMNVMKHHLLRSCVKRLLVGKRVLHPEVSRTTLSVNIPQRNDSNNLQLRFDVTSIQSRSNSSQESLYVILPSTRIIFHSPIENGNNIEDLLSNHPTKTISHITHHKQQKIPPHQYILDSLKYILILNRQSKDTSLPPPTSRAFLFSGPPGVGKTYAVKQAVSIANSWFTLTSNSEDNNEPIKIVSIRGSELLASAEGGQYAAAARELKNQFVMAVRLCERTDDVRKEQEIYSQANAKSVIIFLDECDALVSSAMPVAAMLAMMLDLMESCETSLGWSKLLVVAATNRVDDIPSFLRRPARLEKEVAVGPPDADDRFVLLKDMIAVNSQKHNDDTCNDDNSLGLLRVEVSDEDIHKLADTCVGYVAADLAALVRRAAVLGMERSLFGSSAKPDKEVRRNSPTITMHDLESAMNDVGASCLRDASLSAPPKTTWSDIAGDVGGAKQALKQAIEWPRTHKDAFNALGLSPPRGFLMHGPPGCAKTTLARAAAGSANVAFLSLSPADVYSSSFVGEAESVVRRAFNLARSAAPCVLFFDEIDAIIGGDESSGHGMGRGSSAEARVLSTFLNEMDGVDGSVEDGVLVLGATNRPGTLDRALMRPGRFDRVIYVPPPDECGRRDILRMECSKWYDSFVALVDNAHKDAYYSLDKYFNLRYLAADDITGLMTGAELVGACRETAVNVMRTLLVSDSSGTISEMPQDLLHNLMRVLKVELELTLQRTRPLLSDSAVMEQYMRFEKEHMS
eukprot:scaffold195_cov95-Cyclotella_meneghiniana.AAC.4